MFAPAPVTPAAVGFTVLQSNRRSRKPRVKPPVSSNATCAAESRRRAFAHPVTAPVDRSLKCRSSRSSHAGTGTQSSSVKAISSVWHCSIARLRALSRPGRGSCT